MNTAARTTSDVVDRNVVRIEAHLVRLAKRHDPMGHFFAIERLARSARADWWGAQRGDAHENHLR